MSFMDHLRWVKYVDYGKPLPKTDNRYGCVTSGYLELKLTSLHKSHIRKCYRQYPFENKYYFNNIVLLDHQVERDDFFPCRIYTFFDDYILNTDIIKTINFVVDADCYDDRRKTPMDAIEVTDEYIYLVMLRYIARNNLLNVKM